MNDSSPHVSPDSAKPSAGRRPNFALLPLLLLPLVVLWGAALYGSLQIGKSEEIGRVLGHGVCGPWGCAAKPEALLSWHLFCLLLVAPVGGWLGVRLQVSNALLAGKVMLAIGLGAIGLLVSWAIFDCLVNGPENLRQYWLQIAGFKLVTNTDLPLVPLAIAGLVCWAMGSVRRSASRLSDGRRSDGRRSDGRQATSHQATSHQVATTEQIPADPAEQSPAAAAGSLAGQ